MKIVPSIEGVLHIQFATRLELTLTMCRLQEFYESPYPSIKGKYFSMEDFIKAYSDEKGAIEYFSYWDGFNVPVKVMQEFLARFHDKTKRERLIYAAWDLGDYKYLICTEDGSDPTTAAHEIAHARYAMEPQYQYYVDMELEKIPQGLRWRMQNDLVGGGYPQDHNILGDEIHAYLSTSTEEELLETFPSVKPEERHPIEAALRYVAESAKR